MMISNQFRALENEGIDILFKLQLAPLKGHYVFIIPPLTTFVYGLFTAFQNSEPLDQQF